MCILLSYSLTPSSMAKTKNNSLKYPKPKKILCCFGSPSHKKNSTDTTIEGLESDPNPKLKRTSWFSWTRIRIKKNSASKTVPIEASVSVKAHYSKSRSKSTVSHKSSATNPPPPTETSPVLPVTPYYTPSQTRHGVNNVEDTRQHKGASPPHAKRQARRLSSTVQNQTTSKKHRNARRSLFDPMVGMSVVVVTLVIMIFWGRLCAILCTSAWLYFVPRFMRSVAENDENDSNKKSNDLDLDSEVYKKKVIMEGLLERTHRGTL